MEVLLSSAETRTLARARAILERQLRGPEPLQLDSIAAVKLYLSLRFSGLDHEQMHVLYLDAQHRLLTAEVHAIGTLRTVSVYPREIARSALKHNAGAVILAHNHPSGNPAPSVADKRLTTTVQSALSILDIQLLDHFVVAGIECRSAAAKGEL